MTASHYQLNDDVADPMLVFRLFSLAPGAGGAALTGLFLRLGITASYLAQGVALALCLEAALGHDYSRSVVFLGAVVLAAVMRSGLLYATEAHGGRAGARFRQNLRARLFRHLLQLGPAFLTGRRTGDLQGTIVGAVDGVETYVTRFLPVAANAVAGTVAAVWIIAVFSLPAAAVLACCAVLGPALSISWLTWRRRQPGTRGIFAAIQDSNAWLLESIQGLTTLKLFSAVPARREVIAEKAERLRSRSMETLRVNLLRSGFTTLVALGGTTGVVVWTAAGLASGDSTAVALLAVLTLAREVFRPFQALEGEFHGGVAGAAAARSITELLASPVRSPAKRQSLARGTEIRFERVRFAHDNGDAILEDADLTITAGEHVALTGASGAGKSTVADLLLGFLRPQGGRVLIGGAPVGELADADLRDLVAVVSQAPYIFPGTVAANVRMARPAASDAEVAEACIVADADDFIRALPGGYASEVGEGGGRLSTGQKQRIAIARAVLRNAPVLVLDESTSNLDVETEARIQARLAAHRAGQTTIVIAHRASALRGADRVLRVDAGKIRPTSHPDRQTRHQPEFVGDPA